VTEDRLKLIEQELEAIKQRTAGVEADKNSCFARTSAGKGTEYNKPAMDNETLRLPADGRPLPSWRAMHMDTSPWAEELQLKFYRDAPAWRKLEVAGDLTRGLLILAEAGLKERYPKDSPAMLRRRLAGVILGADLAAQVYGPLDQLDDSVT